MPRWLRSVVLISSLITSFSLFLIAQEDAGRRISPENINIQMGDDRALQLLDDSSLGKDMKSFSRTKQMLSKALKGSVDSVYISP